MTTRFYLTDEIADVSPASGAYYRLKLGARSDNPSLFRSITNTAAGPSSGIQLTRTAAGTVVAWITDRLTGVNLTAAAWIFHVWAKESAIAANAALRFQILPFTVAEETAALDDNGAVELGTASADYARTSDAATATTIADGDRLVLKILLDDAGTMGADQTVTVSYNGQLPGAEGDSYVICPDTLAITAQVPAATLTRIRTALMDTDLTHPLLDDAQIRRSFDLALREYSSDRPRLAVDLLSGDGSAYDFVLPRHWVAGFSSISTVEYPTGEQQAALLAPEDFSVIQSALGTGYTRRLHFPLITPESGTDNIAVRYTTRHSHTDELDTVPADDLDAVSLLAASYGAQFLAAKAAASQDPTISADFVGRGFSTETERWLKLAKEYRAAYGRHLGLGGEDGGAPVAAGFHFQDWDVNLSGGADRLFHPRRLR